MKIALTFNMYLVPNIDNPIIRIPIWQETQTFETHIIGDITIEKILIVYIAYCYIVGLGPNCKFIDLLFKRLVITFNKISSFIVSLF